MVGSKFILKIFYSFIFANFYFTTLQTAIYISAHINYSVSETDGLDELFLQMKFIVVYKDQKEEDNFCGLFICEKLQ